MILPGIVGGAVVDADDLEVGEASGLDRLSSVCSRYGSALRTGMITETADTFWTPVGTHRAAVRREPLHSLANPEASAPPGAWRQSLREFRQRPAPCQRVPNCLLTMSAFGPPIRARALRLLRRCVQQPSHIPGTGSGPIRSPAIPLRWLRQRQSTSSNTVVAFAGAEVDDVVAGSRSPDSDDGVEALQRRNMRPRARSQTWM